MQIDKLLQLFIPQDKQFLPLLKKASDHLVDVSTLLCDLLKSDLNGRSKIVKEIEDVEAQSDEIRHEILHELSVNFITPFDKEDIHELAKNIDKIVDYIYGAAKRIELYKTNSTDEMISIASLLSKASVTIQTSVYEFHNMRKLNGIKDRCVDLQKIENEAEGIFYRAFGNLFENERNPIEIIKLKEIFISMKSAINKCEEASDLIESIVVKNV